MVRLKLTGTKKEIEEMISLLSDVATVTEQSDYYENRGSSYYRVYVSVDINEEEKQND